MTKFFLGIKAILFYLIMKIRYGKRCSLYVVNSLRGTTKVDLQTNATLKIGNFLMTQGPLYLKILVNGKVKIGNNVFFNHNCSITAADSVIIGNNVTIANNVVIVDHDHVMDSRGVVQNELSTMPVVIEDNSWIAANVTITKGVHIGTGAVVAAGAVVTHDVPAHTIFAGVPAKKVRALNTSNNKDG